jgi:predicted tellurium resistance membrane protein TerC
MQSLLLDPSAWLALATLTTLEVVLGVDNIVFLSMLVGRLPAEQQRLARLGGLALAMLTRVGLLLSVTWLTTLVDPLLTLFDRSLSVRDLALLGGGLFLLWKSVLEIHATVEGPVESAAVRPARGNHRVALVMLQIALVDIVFSLDSVFTAIGFAQQTPVMVVAIVLSMIFMMAVCGQIGAFIERHKTVKVLALAFLILVGVTLVADAFAVHIPKGYLYFAMAFAIVVELVNLRVRERASDRTRPDQP